MDNAGNTTPTIEADTSTIEASALTKLPDNTCTLDEPLHRGKTTIEHVTLRRPKTGELRGLNLQDLLQLDVNALQKLLPRISNPSLTTQEVAELDPADLVQLGTVAISFFIPKAQTPASLTA